MTPLLISYAVFPVYFFKSKGNGYIFMITFRCVTVAAKSWCSVFGDAAWRLRLCVRSPKSRLVMVHAAE
jgi:hypothetical protein